MPSFLQGLGLLANVAGGALEGYGLDKRRRIEEALEAAKEQREKEAAELMRRVQEQNLASSITNQDLAAAAAGFRAPKALKAAIGKNLTPDLTRTAGFAGVPSLPFDAPSAREQMQDDLPTLNVRGQQLVQDPTQTPTAIEQRNKRAEWEWQRDADIAAAALKARGDAAAEALRDKNRIRVAEIQAGTRGGGEGRPWTAAMATGQAARRALLMSAGKASAALDLAVEKKVDATGRVGGIIPTTAWIKQTGVTGQNAPEALDVQQLMGDFNSLVSNLRSGGAIPAQEFERLEEFLPSPNMSEKNNQRALKNYIATLKDIIDTYQTEYENAGFRRQPGNVAPPTRNLPNPRDD